MACEKSYSSAAILSALNICKRNVVSGNTLTHPVPVSLKLEAKTWVEFRRALSNGKSVRCTLMDVD